MEKLIPRFFFFLVLALSNLNSRVDGGGFTSKQALEDVDRKLKLLNKPAVKSIQSEDGDIIDCVDIHKQPAFDHPTLRNHIIQMRPSSGFLKENLSTKNKSSNPVIFQTWQKSGSCPQGTIPIRRVQRHDIFRATSPDHFGRKPPLVFSASNTTNQKDNLPYINNTKLQLGPIVNRSIGILLTTGYNYIGAKADINVWEPYVESPEDYSSAQIWLIGGPGNDFESVESGWMVNPKLYGDTRTRLFVYWTADAYKKTGCFDLTCSGFVQTSSEVALGSAIEPVSTISRDQYHITVGIYLDPKSGNWWLHFGDTKVVGYWPANSLMFYLKQSAILVEWGGEVYSPNVKKTPHTKTAMGSGNFASGLFSNACFMDNVRIVDFSLSLKYPEWVSTWGDEYDCYSVLNDVKYGVYPVFYFGGPGQGHFCP